MAHFYQWLLVSTLILILVPWSGAEKDDDEMTEYRFGPRLPIQRIAEANPGKSTTAHGRAPTWITWGENGISEYRGGPRPWRVRVRRDTSGDGSAIKNVGLSESPMSRTRRWIPWRMYRPWGLPYGGWGYPYGGFGYPYYAPWGGGFGIGLGFGGMFFG
ncbi:unnamed protein product [Heligmosomoides polygyrus]|uniref:CX domain-containing protein n=1 Tax=Heligmosomoides polygyrus TaxID=6339 RepID=A0A183FK30_HELPZ|nr:unnamed protein product [Heligmosomoides polygyrus]